MDAWLENNGRYLEASLKWLRLRLQQLVPEDLAQHAHHSLSEDSASSREELLKSAAALREECACIDPPPALVLLAHRFGLSDFERDTLLLCAALEFDPSLAALCGIAQGSTSRNYPTFALALALFDETSWDALAAHRPLRYSRLLEISQPGSVPLTAAALRADERIVNFLKGLNVLDDRLAMLFQPVSTEFNSVLSSSQREIVDAILQRLTRSDSAILPPLQLAGVDAGSRLAVAQQVCEETGRLLFVLNTDTMPTSLGEIETLARLWQRETALLPVALYIDADAAELNSADMLSRLRNFLSRQIGIVFVAVREPTVQLSDAMFTIEVQRPTAAEQCEAWTTILRVLEADSASDQTPQVLAGQFNLNLSDIRNVATVALDTPGNEGIRQKLWHTCRNLTRASLDSLAQRLEPKATWDDLVLPDEQMELMRRIAGQVRDRYRVYDQWGFARTMNRGFGISALFAGESGTGKTMAAEVIANDLQLNLYRIDLSAVVSKYIGETEKNLRKLFDGAERGGAILFFDEADALFGKRSEVKDSHDRYANIEINYLLQRMEAFSGLAILATNMKGALDAAFSRRLRFVVNLPFPGLKERKLIWQKALPAETPKKDLDYERLARLNLSGGNIHSIALNAAFMAAQNGQTVTMPIIMNAARAELKKLDKGFSESELRLTGGMKAQA